MRQQRITTSQQEVYLIYLMNNSEFAGSKIKDGEYVDNWNELTTMLNNTLGPKKAIEEWKMLFLNWKNQLRTRAKKLKSISDGNCGSDDKLALQKLTDVEKRALKLWKEDFQDKDIASILNEIENKDITITPINRPVAKKRKITTDSIIVMSNTQLAPPATCSTPIHVRTLQSPIQRTKDDLSELINMKLEPFEEMINTPQLKSSTDIQVQEILDWAKNFHIQQPAVDALLNVLKVKRNKNENKNESSLGSAASNSLQQQTVGLFTKVFARLDKMESHLVQRITVLERKVDLKQFQAVKGQNQPNK